MPYAKRRRTTNGTLPLNRVRAPGRPLRRRIPVRVRTKPRTSRKRVMRDRRNARKVIKNVVEKVMACKDNVGIYTKTYTGEIRCDVLLGTKTVAVHAQRLQANAGDYTEFGMSFHPYTLKRVLDAASVLYNNKTKSIAGPGVLGATNFTPIGLKVDLLYASYHLAMTNMTNTQYHVEIVEFTNKFNSNAGVMDVLSELLRGTNWSQGIPVMGNAGNGIWRMECDLQFGMIKGLSNRYAMKSFGKKLVKPGTTINYFTKDKMCVDYQKKLVTEGEGADPEIPSFSKGEKQVIVVLYPVVGIVSNGTTYTYCENTVADDANNGFVVKIDEVFKMIEPDATLDEYQGDKRVFFSDHGVPPGGPLNRIDRDYGPTSTNFSSIV